MSLRTKFERKKEQYFFKKSKFQLENLNIKELIGSFDQFERTLFYASIKNSLDSANPLRFNNFAYSLRELLNIYIHRQSPNEFILNCTWFLGTKDEIKRQHRIKYLIQKGLSNEIIEDVLESCPESIDNLTTEFNKIFDKLNKFTHINKNSYNMAPSEAQSYFYTLIKSFIGFFEMAKELESQIQETLGSYIEDHLHDEIMDSTIGEIGWVRKRGHPL